MGSRSSGFVWMATFTASVFFAAALACEMKGISILPSSAAALIDDGPVAKLILIVFAASLIINARNSAYVIHEFSNLRRGLRSDPSSSQLKLNGDGLLGEHAARMHQIYGHAFEGDVSQAVSLGVIRSRLFGREWLVRTSSQLLLTLGLIGTVLGLARSLDGLSVTIRSMAQNTSTESAADAAPDAAPGDFNGGLQSAVGGMAAAFATTLFGAILGGVFLRLLGNCTQYLADELVDGIEIAAETELVPLLRASKGDVSLRRREMVAFIDKTVEKETARLRQIAEQVQTITGKFDQLANSMRSAQRNGASFPR